MSSRYVSARAACQITSILTASQYLCMAPHLLNQTQNEILTASSASMGFHLSLFINFYINVLYHLYNQSHQPFLIFHLSNPLCFPQSFRLVLTPSPSFRSILGEMSSFLYGAVDEI
ncbi:hypothetical protein L202_01157 [Cryptococcus amylolentus CBS 6039]|uniref:Uncharacterized protein n=1 Tax=Cryptococcus amylolentus CBS 6039 TaxID=1295533 RepID=A0A1E3I514_9TREE|nr:hypothetical protein L202_01157 [Cryptococcus amylolentus CBS 6039]ODN82906.1 hypothetical protein L202_01157 [Cryptococcus amylolentus CBS 6039]